MIRLHLGIMVAACLCLSFGVLAAGAAPRPIASIAAVINGAPVSGYDLDQYIRLNLAISSLEWNEENVVRVRAHSLERLIEDQLKLQEARRLGIAIQRREVDSAIGRMVAQSRMERDEFIAYLERHHIALATLEQRISADIAWNKIVRQAIAPKILIRQQEVERLLARQIANADESRYLLSEILIRVEKGEETEKRNLAEQLRGRLTENRNSFPLAAGQFSDAASSLRGGDIGWIGKNALREEWREAVLTLTPGSVSSPISTQEGYYLLLLRDRELGGEDASLHQEVRLLSLRFPSARTEGETAQLAEKMEEAFGDCESVLTETRTEGGEFDDFGYLGSADLSDDIREKVQQAEPGKALRQTLSTSGASILFFCARRQEERRVASREQIEYSLINERAGVQAVRYLRNLRRNSEIEIRL